MALVPFSKGRKSGDSGYTTRKGRMPDRHRGGNPENAQNGGPAGQLDVGHTDGHLYTELRGTQNRRGNDISGQKVRGSSSRQNSPARRF